MEQRVCNFCGDPIEPGTGMMFIKKDGTTLYFDRRRCRMSLLKMNRIPRRFKWTRHYPRGAKTEQQVREEADREAARAGTGGAPKKAKVKREVKVKPSE